MWKGETNQNLGEKEYITRKGGPSVGGRWGCNLGGFSRKSVESKMPIV